MNFSIQRSPAKVCWWVLCNGVLLSTADTKSEATHYMNKLKASYA
jgi:hypothetical protein